MRYKCAFPHQLSNVGKVVLSRKGVHVFEKLVLRNTSQRVLDPRSLNKELRRDRVTYSPVVFSVIAAILARRFSSSPIRIDALRPDMMFVVSVRVIQVKVNEADGCAGHETAATKFEAYLAGLQPI